jgi:hypothetical protein
MNSISVLILFFSMWPFSGSKTYPMTADSSVPAASGDVSVHRGGANRNTELDIKVSNLARPANLASPGNVYIVWLQPNNQAAANQGALRVNKNLDGELKAATTSKDCEVFITAEQSATATAPTGLQVLHTHITLD